MTNELAFSCRAARIGKCAFRDAEAPEAVIRSRIRQELGLCGDTLWRMTTKPWARARRAADGPPTHRFSDRLEVGITALSMMGMAVATLACFVA